ncbi:MAG TPA: amidohydrolase family protein [Chthoniobacterales bacterium]|nr:amidohydrolase family protein [Chthoniobacterales bacterium]
MIIRARVVVTMDGPPIDNGAVVILRDRIVDVGTFPEIREKHSGEDVFDLGEQVLLPGLINAHCHLDYTCLRGKIPRQKSFTDWIRAINAEKENLSVENYVASINDGFSEAQRFATTTIANLTAFPELVSRIEPSIRICWFAELIDVRNPSRAREILDSAVDQLKSRKHWGLAPHAPFTASANLYRLCEEIAKRENILLTTHLAESREEMSMFRDASGTLYDFLNDIGRDMSDCNGTTPVNCFLDRDVSLNRSQPPVRLGLIEGNRRYLVTHLNELSENDFSSLRTWADNFAIVHCPRSHQYFGHSPFQLEKLRGLGFNICLGTDSLASNEDLSLFAEMRAFQKEFPDVRPEEILKMVTLNPARALAEESALGQIRTNFLADLVALPLTGSTFAIDEILAFDGLVGWSMIGGMVSV